MPVRGQEVPEFVPKLGHTTEINDLAFSPDGKLLATVGGAHWPVSDAEVRLWNVEDRGCCATSGDAGSIRVRKTVAGNALGLYTEFMRSRAPGYLAGRELRERLRTASPPES